MDQVAAFAVPAFDIADADVVGLGDVPECFAGSDGVGDLTAAGRLGIVDRRGSGLGQYRRRLGGNTALIAAGEQPDVQALARFDQAGVAEAVPGADLRQGYIIAPGDFPEGIALFHHIFMFFPAGDVLYRFAAPNAVPRGRGRFAGGIFLAHFGIRRYRNHQALADPDQGAADLVKTLDLGNADPIAPADGGKGLAGAHPVMGPAHLLFFGDVRIFGGEGFPFPLGQVEGPALHVRGGAPAQQPRIEAFHLLKAAADRLSHHVEINAFLHRHGVEDQRFGTVADLEAVFPRIGGDGDCRQIGRHIIAGFPGQPGQGPEVADILLAQAPLDLARAEVIAGDGQVPVAKALIEVHQMAGGGPGGLDRIAPVVKPPAILQAVGAAGGGDELPHAHRPGPGAGLAVKAAFDHRQVEELFRRAFLAEDLLYHRPVGAGAFQPALKHLPAFTAGEILDRSFHLAVDYDRDFQLLGVGRDRGIEITVAFGGIEFAEFLEHKISGERVGGGGIQRRQIIIISGQGAALQVQEGGMEFVGEG